MASAEDMTTVTCPSCDYSVSQVRGTRRTICPNCGNFYSREAAEMSRANLQQRNAHHTNRLPNLQDRPPSRRSNNRLQSLANFFQNFRSQSQRSSSSSQASSIDSESSHVSKIDLPAIHPNLDNKFTNGTGNQEYDQKSTHRKLIGSEFNEQVDDVHNTKKLYCSKDIQNFAKKTPEKLRENFYVGKGTGCWEEIKEFYTAAFYSFSNMNEIFKKNSANIDVNRGESGIHVDLLDTTYDLLSEVPVEIQKLVLKSTAGSLMKKQRPVNKVDIQAYFILLQSPLFVQHSTYGIFAYLLRQVAALSDHDHHYLVHWMKGLKTNVFKQMLQRLHAFISWGLFPSKPQQLPVWWIPCAVKVMALLNAANNLDKPLVSYMDFYNTSLDHLDLLSEYYKWQNMSSYRGFSFCQYPFILSNLAKRSILQRDSEQQMIVMARRSLVDKVQRRQLPDIGLLFLNLNVRRSHLVSDSLNEISRKQLELKKKLKVTFSGEPGLDMGGLTKEWFLLLIRQIFDTNYGMFTYDQKAGVFWFSSAPCENYQEFNLVGVLMGLAVYNSIILDIRFPLCCYKKLLSPAVVPYHNQQATVGVGPLKLEDLKQVQPDVSNGLKELLAYEGDVEEDFCLNFQVSTNELGIVRRHNLKVDGENLPVTNTNKKEYVQLYVDWILNKSIYYQFRAFYHGFHSVCASNALIMLCPDEVEMLVCGCPTFDMKELKKVTTYDGYTLHDQTIKFFWDVVLKFPKDLQKMLLLFTTGSDRIPIGGMSEMQFKITRVEGTSLLPMSHTCFNQLVLPAYKNKKMLRKKIITAIQNAEGFGLE